MNSEKPAKKLNLPYHQAISILLFSNALVCLLLKDASSLTHVMVFIFGLSMAIIVFAYQDLERLAKDENYLNKSEKTSDNEEREYEKEDDQMETGHLLPQEFSSTTTTNDNETVAHVPNLYFVNPSASNTQRKKRNNVGGGGLTLDDLLPSAYNSKQKKRYMSLTCFDVG